MDSPADTATAPVQDPAETTGPPVESPAGSAQAGSQPADEAEAGEPAAADPNAQRPSFGTAAAAGTAVAAGIATAAGHRDADDADAGAAEPVRSADSRTDDPWETDDRRPATQDSGAPDSGTDVAGPDVVTPDGPSADGFGTDGSGRDDSGRDDSGRDDSSRDDSGTDDSAGPASEFAAGASVPPPRTEERVDDPGRGWATVPDHDAPADATQQMSAPTMDDRADAGGYGSPPGSDVFAPPPPGQEPPEESSGAETSALVATLEDEVVVVDEQPRYHVVECRGLVGQSVIPLPVREAVELGFTPCAWCQPNRRLASQHPAAVR